MKIAIIGASGFLGMRLMSLLSNDNEVIGTYSSTERKGLVKLDATDENAVMDFLFNEKPDLVIDTVALTSSMVCEKNPELCKKLNYITAKNISHACKQISAKMVFMSSTYLFDGEKGNYNEEDKTSAINQYAKTKIMAENELLHSDSIILRVDVMYGYNGEELPNGVFDWILSGKEISLREPNQIRQPVLVDDIAEVIINLAKKNQKGIFHVAGPTRIFMIEFLKKLEILVRKDSRIKISYEKPENIKIPKNATLDISKIKNLGIETHSLDEGLEIIKEQLKKS